jgi:adenosylmethionine-8-amino-7-oxononanoate aminotransferase
MVDEALRRNLSIYPGAGTADGVKGDHVILAPPYNMSDEDFAAMMELLVATYDTVEKEVDSLLSKSTIC